MFVTEVGAGSRRSLVSRGCRRRRRRCTPVIGQICAWLWFTVLFANFAEAVAEGARQGAGRERCAGRAGETTAHRLELRRGTRPRTCRAAACAAGDLVVVAAGEVIPGDGEVVEGIASVDESAITGESAPVIRESGGDRSAVTGGTRVLSDRIVSDHGRTRARGSSTA